MFKGLYYSIVLFLLSTTVLHAQSFSVVPEVGYLVSQVDGDDLDGYDKKGYQIGLIANYPLFYNGHIAIGGHYFFHGSQKKKNEYRVINGLVSQIELELQTVGLELSYIQRLNNPRIYLFGGLHYHRVLESEGTLHVREQGKTRISIINSEAEAATSFWSFKYGIGANVYKKIRLNFSVHSGINKMTYIIPEEKISSKLRPLSLHLTLGYELISSKAKAKKQRKRKRTKNLK